jgi:hypothetical protein
MKQLEFGGAILREIGGVGRLHKPKGRTSLALQYCKASRHSQRVRSRLPSPATPMKG